MRTESFLYSLSFSFFMIWKQGLGIGLIFAGFYIAFTADTFTGAIIGAQKENLLGWVGLVVLILGMFFVLTTRQKKEEDEII